MWNTFLNIIFFSEDFSAFHGFYITTEYFIFLSSLSDKIDQVFDLLEKVYVELQETKREVQETQKEVKENSRHITKLEAVIENEIKPDLKTFYEVQVQMNEHLERHDKRFDVLETKVDALSTKTLRHSFEIGALKRREDRAR